MTTNAIINHNPFTRLFGIFTLDKRKKIYPKSVAGRFRVLRRLVSLAILGIYFILPWFKIDGRQAILFDIPARKFYVFNLVFWPQEVFYLTFVMIFLAIALFFFTTLAGRLWCGYACPQTVFTDIFVSIERFFEGDRNERMALDNAPWGVSKFARKGLKVGSWLAFSFATSFTFVSYFTSPGVLAERIFTGSLTKANAVSLALFTGATYLFCGFLRELICLVPCPYGRFQSALMDPDTLIIGYDTRRGEPRGHLRRDEKRLLIPEGKGDCIDCSLCVQVCPTGIDIRNGLQYECIGCAQCIDACNSVMRHINRPEGLVRYGSLKIFAGGTTKIVRPRLIVYASILVVLMSGLIYKITNRTPLDIDVLRSRNSLYQRMPDGRISNLYTIKILNMDRNDHRYLVRIEGIEAKLILGNNPVSVKGGEIYQASASLIIEEKDAAKKISHFNFVIEDVDKPKIKARRESTFLAPVM